MLDCTAQSSYDARKQHLIEQTRPFECGSTLSRYYVTTMCRSQSPSEHPRRDSTGRCDHPWVSRQQSNDVASDISSQFGRWRDGRFGLWPSSTVPATFRIEHQDTRQSKAGLDASHGRFGFVPAGPSLALIPMLENRQACFVRESLLLRLLIRAPVASPFLHRWGVCRHPSVSHKSDKSSLT